MTPRLERMRKKRMATKDLDDIATGVGVAGEGRIVLLFWSIPLCPSFAALYVSSDSEKC